LSHSGKQHEDWQWDWLQLLAVADAATFALAEVGTASHRSIHDVLVASFAVAIAVATSAAAATQ